MKQKRGAHRPDKGRVAARGALGTVVAGLCAFVLFGTGSVGALAQVLPVQTTESPTSEPSEEPTETPSPTPTQPTGPGIALLNPAVEYHPGLAESNPTTDDIPRISDKFDGANETYHVVASTRRAPQGATVQAYWTPSGGVETSIGQLTKIDSLANTWGLQWDIPAELSGDGVLSVKLLNGSNEIAKDSEEAIIDNAEESVEMTWPSNGGRLGFFKPRAGKWRGVIEGTASRFAQRVYVFYTTTPPGTPDVEYKICIGTSIGASYVAPAAPPTGQEFRTWTATCELQGKDTPSQVTAIATMAGETDNLAQPGGPGLITNESGDVHRVSGYMQDPADMTVSIAAVQPTATSAAYPTADAQQAGNDCLEFDVTVLDGLGRPVQGANVDVHAEGPTDEVGFGDEANTTHGSSGDKPPDQGGHEKEPAWDCDSPGDNFGEQAEHDQPNGDDLKHIESLPTGTGLSGPSGIKPGQFRFHLFSPEPGRTRLTAWVDEKPLAKETDNRDLDNDKLTEGEAFARADAQWLAGPAQVTLNPASDTFITGQCAPITVTVRGGRTRVEDANVDIHASGPTDDLDFCDPQNASDNRAPDLGEHDNENAGESTHAAADEDSSTTQHTEGETDDGGSFVIGLTSPTDGDTTLQAWIDGTKGTDNDTQQTTEPTANGTYTWASGADDATVRFLNPSGYGDGAGDNISTNNDGNNYFHIVTRVDLPDLVQGVEILISSDGANFSKLGDATRVGDSEVFEFKWTAANVQQRAYTLRAQITGTDRFEDRAVTLDNSLQTVELSRPANNEVVAFIEQKATIAGTASADAQGVTFYYTKTAARDPNDAWVECGSVELPAPGDAPQQFEGECTLAENDQASSVTGIAAIADICDLAGCEPPLGGIVHESGDAHRAFGLDSTPIVGLIPTDGEGAAGTCQRVVVDVEDQAGGPVPNANVDVHMKGPSRKIHFCNPSGQWDNRNAPDEGNHAPVTGEPDEGKHQNSETIHTEGKSNSNGRFVVGIVSPGEGNSRITAWIDQTEDDVEGSEESRAQATFTWIKAGRCTRSGTGGDDVLTGTPGDDRICGLGGDDVINGRGGNDVIIGGGGRDILRGENGRDRLVGGANEDSLVGGAGNDKLVSGKGHDVLAGKGGRDTLRGGPNNDNLKGGGGQDSCYGNRGTDRFSGCERQQQ